MGTDLGNLSGILIPRPHRPQEGWSVGVLGGSVYLDRVILGIKKNVGNCENSKISKNRNFSKHVIYTF